MAEDARWCGVRLTGYLSGRGVCGPGSELPTFPFVFGSGVVCLAPQPHENEKLWEDIDNAEEGHPSHGDTATAAETWGCTLALKILIREAPRRKRMALQRASAEVQLSVSI